MAHAALMLTGCSGDTSTRCTEPLLVRNVLSRAGAIAGAIEGGVAGAIDGAMMTARERPTPQAMLEPTPKNARCADGERDKDCVHAAQSAWQPRRCRRRRHVECGSPHGFPGARAFGLTDLRRVRHLIDEFDEAAPRCVSTATRSMHAARGSAPSAASPPKQGGATTATTR